MQENLRKTSFYIIKLKLRSLKLFRMSGKILITGASGLLGREVLSFLQNQFKWKCLGLCFSRNKNSNLKSCDLTDFNQINTIIDEFKVCLIFNYSKLLIFHSKTAKRDNSLCS
jgi:dTDP-4-dehydrorhamnose reductase